VVVEVTVLVVVVVVVCMVEVAGLVLVFRVEEVAFLVLVVIELPATLHCPPTTPAEGCFQHKSTLSSETTQYFSTTLLSVLKNKAKSRL